jgi:hypothetical protein
MGFVTKAFSGDKEAKQAAAAQAAAIAKQEAEQKRQADLVADREAKTKAAELAARRIRSGQRKGLLSFSEDGAGTMGGSSA